MPLKHKFIPMTDASLETLVPGEWLLTRHLKFVQFLRHDGAPGNLIYCSEVFLVIPDSDVFVEITEECVDTGTEVLYSVKTLSKI